MPIINPNELQLLNFPIVKHIFVIAVVNMNSLEKRKIINKKNDQLFGQHTSKIEKL